MRAKNDGRMDLEPAEPKLDQKDEASLLEQLFKDLLGLLPEQRANVEREAREFVDYYQTLRGAYRFNEFLFRPRTSTKKAHKEVDLLKQQAKKLKATIKDIGGDALMAFDPPRYLWDIGWRLDGLIKQSKLAHARLAKENNPAPKGRPKPFEQQITEKALDVYTRLTGKQSGRSVDPITSKYTGRLFRFVDEIFRILNINASAGNQIRVIMAKKKLK